MSAPVISEVAEGMPAADVGLRVGDAILSINGVVPLDVIEFQQLTDAARVEMVIRRTGAPLDKKMVVEKEIGAPLGIRVDSAVFDKIRTCDNHCEFCFIYQLPKGMRRSLYLKDDDYRLSFLYGNFTTLTRFTELDAERVVTERLSPLYVSIHATDPALRAAMLRNPRGATSLQWLDVLLDEGIEVHGQIVVCPGVNDGAHLERTLLDCLDRFVELSSVGVVPLGVSDHTTEPAMRPHRPDEVRATLAMVERFGEHSRRLTGRRRIYAADEYYILAGRVPPAAAHYEGFTQIENGIGMTRAFEDDALGSSPERPAHGGGFFQAVDAAPPWGYRAERSALSSSRSDEPPVLVTSQYGAVVLSRVLQELDTSEIEILEVPNRFFGGNIAVAGLMTGADIDDALRRHGGNARYVLPDVCLNEGRFLDGLGIDDLSSPVEVIATSGGALRSLVGARARVAAETS